MPGFEQLLVDTVRHRPDQQRARADRWKCSLVSTRLPALTDRARLSAVPRRANHMVHMPLIDDEFTADSEPGFRRSEEDHRLGNLHRVSEAAERNLRLSIVSFRTQIVSMYAGNALVTVDRTPKSRLSRVRD